jgi:hypothetical protein
MTSMAGTFFLDQRAHDSLGGKRSRGLTAQKRPTSPPQGPGMAPVVSGGEKIASEAGSDQAAEDRDRC